MSVADARQSERLDEAEGFLNLRRLTRRKATEYGQHFVHEEFRNHETGRIALYLVKHLRRFCNQGFILYEPFDRYRRIENRHERKSRRMSSVVPVAGGSNCSFFNRITTSRRRSSASRSTNRSR